MAHQRDMHHFLSGRLSVGLTFAIGVAAAAAEPTDPLPEVPVVRKLPPDAKTLVTTSDEIPQEWRITTAAPAAGWEKPDFDASGWKLVLGGIGYGDPPGSKVRSTWRSEDVWARREFSLSSAEITDLWLRIHHDEDAEVYLNGVKIAQTRRFTTAYVHLDVPKDRESALKVGRNVLAVHCHHSGGGQYIDVGLVDCPTEPHE